ncbi:hypothetical protein SSX86_030875 [Deinandra increscens subsp. villosa]|uniref:RRM domain-containing protein n=1 Tax=Deinandra increscens subsp. villosa TaxID=3103831 RepID=A0AAP0CAP6_9ASTR
MVKNNGQNSDGHEREIAGENIHRDDEWQEVKRKSSRPRHTNGNIRENRNRWMNTTTFFISNIPKGIKSQDLRSVFERYGQVADAIVPFRPAKSGSSFGFVNRQIQRDGNKISREKPSTQKPSVARPNDLAGETQGTDAK